MVGVMQEFGWQAVNILYEDSTWGQGFATGVRVCMCVSVPFESGNLSRSLLGHILSSTPYCLPLFQAPLPLPFSHARTHSALFPPPFFIHLVITRQT